MRYHYTYKITFYKEDKYYLGQHSTDNLDDNYCGSGKYCDWYFKKYGKDNTYKKEILAFYDSLDALNKAEYDLIGDKFITDTKCANKTFGGGILAPKYGKSNPFYGRKHSEKTKQYLRELFKGRTPTNLESFRRYGFNNSKPVKQFSRDGKLIKEWDKLCIAAKELKINGSSIGSVCKGKRLAAGGFIWRYKEDDFNTHRTTKLKISEQTIEKRRKNCSLNKRVQQFDSSGNLLGEYRSIKEAERQTGVCDSSIAACAKGKRKSAGGYLWIYS